MTQFEQAFASLFKFAAKLGAMPIDAAFTIYKSRPVPVASYGAGVWGYT